MAEGVSGTRWCCPGVPSLLLNWSLDCHAPHPVSAPRGAAVTQDLSSPSCLSQRAPTEDTITGTDTWCHEIRDSQNQPSLEDPGSEPMLWPVPRKLWEDQIPSFPVSQLVRALPTALSKPPPGQKCPHYPLCFLNPTACKATWEPQAGCPFARSLLD